jgi:hypothetical protein
MIERIDKELEAGDRLVRLWRHAARESAVARIASLIDAESTPK